MSIVASDSTVGGCASTASVLLDGDEDDGRLSVVLVVGTTVVLAVSLEEEAFVVAGGEVGSKMSVLSSSF